MKKNVFLLLAVLLPSAAFGKVAVVDNFNSKLEQNMLGGAMGVWIGDPSDESQGCQSEFSDTEKFGEKGSSLRLTYDVDSPNPAFGGYWMKLENLDATPYKQLVFMVKGDPAGYPTYFAVELKNEKQSGKFTVRKVNAQWQKMAIPFSEFTGITDFSALTEFVVVFAFENIDRLTGGIYLDDICFSDGVYDNVPEKYVASTQLVKQPAQEDLAGVAADASGEGLDVRQEKDAVVITLRINFAPGKAAMGKNEREKIGQIAGILKKHASLKVNINGYTDNTGSKALNKKLSGARAIAVKDELVRTGIEASRLTPAGMGMDRPVADNSTQEGRAKNRRVEFILIK